MASQRPVLTAVAAAPNTFISAMPCSGLKALRSFRNVTITSSPHTADNRAVRYSRFVYCVFLAIYLIAMQQLRKTIHFLATSCKQMLFSMLYAVSVL
ncbi:hypothetical protein [Zobellella maritima]|uniref:hypothetical protein n=1 Tax=Zobellella maritima TaxID=2059725 RepID=UPI001300A690|nr:hypothetical protein [Zobellella maritima]